MTTMLTLDTALKSTNLQVFYQQARTSANKYLVYSEDSVGSTLHANNKLQEQTIKGTIDLFIRNKTVSDKTFIDVQNALSNADIIFDLNSIQFEHDTNFTHYEWIFEVDRWQK